MIIKTAIKRGRNHCTLFARSGKDTVSVLVDYEEPGPQDHVYAARFLCRKLHKTGVLLLLTVSPTERTFAYFDEEPTLYQVTP